MIPSAVVFDLGKVLIDFNYQVAADRFAARSTMPAAEIRQLLDHSPLLFRLETGLMTDAEFFSEVSATIGFKGAFEEFAGIFGDIFTEIPEMIAFQAALQKRGVPTYIFSNTNEMAVRHVQHAFPFFGNFTGYVYSYQHKVMKPNAGLYEVVEKVTGCSGPAILYLDDKAENVASGTKRGWQTVVHRTPGESLAIAKSLGLPII